LTSCFRRSAIWGPRSTKRRMKPPGCARLSAAVNSLHKPPAPPVRIEKVLPLPRDHGISI
jgi:hypothetical protein